MTRDKKIAIAAVVIAVLAMTGATAGAIALTAGGSGNTLAQAGTTTTTPGLLKARPGKIAFIHTQAANANSCLTVVDASNGAGKDISCDLPANPKGYELVWDPHGGLIVASKSFIVTDPAQPGATYDVRTISTYNPTTGAKLFSYQAGTNGEATVNLTNTLQVTNANGVSSVSFINGNKTIYSATNTSLYKFKDALVSPDKKSIAILDSSNQVLVVDADGINESVLYSAGNGAGVAIGSPAWYQPGFTTKVHDSTLLEPGSLNGVSHSAPNVSYWNGTDFFPLELGGATVLGAGNPTTTIAPVTSVPKTLDPKIHGGELAFLHHTAADQNGYCLTMINAGTGVGKTVACSITPGNPINSPTLSWTSDGKLVITMLAANARQVNGAFSSWSAYDVLEYDPSTGNKLASFQTADSTSSENNSLVVDKNGTSIDDYLQSQDIVFTGSGNTQLLAAVRAPDSLEAESQWMAIASTDGRIQLADKNGRNAKVLYQEGGASGMWVGPSDASLLVWYQPSALTQSVDVNQLRADAPS